MCIMDMYMHQRIGGIKMIAARFTALALIAFVLFSACVSYSDKNRLRKGDYDDFETWYKVNAEPLIGPAGGLLQGKHLEEGGVREVHVNEVGRPVFTSDEELQIPQGTIIVKDTYYLNEDGTRGKRWNITVMRKREAGYDPEYNDWEYVEAGPGKNVKYQGKLEVCIDCHLAADRDYVFTWK